MKPARIFKWSSHQPLINAGIKILNPELIVELGIGYYSTPLLNSSNAGKIIHIENEKEWLEIVQKEDIFSQKNDFRHHFLGEQINKSTSQSVISEDQKESIVEYYKSLKNEILNLNYTKRMLFVDHFTCARALSINTLYSVFDIIIYHDAEYPEIYNYVFDSDIKKSHDHYVFCPESSHTGIFLRHNLSSYDTIVTILKEEFEKYALGLNIKNTKFDLIKKS